MIEYINRHLKDAFLRASAEYPALLLTGPRQTGKTTMLKRLMEAEKKSRTYVTLDDYDALTVAIGDPAMFFQMYKPPILIDEIQYAPSLFSGIKKLIDRGAKPGDFWMTGSQLFKMMKGVKESLAGRLALFHLSPLSQQEIYSNCEPCVYQNNYQILLNRDEKTAQASPDDIYKRIFNGSMPALISGKFTDRELYYSSYVKTYLERDIRDMAPGIDFLKFTDFIRAAAARTSQLVNYKHIADDASMNQETAKSRLQLLETLGIIFYIHPYHNNVLKRMIKTPKLYFYDTGLAVFLTKWNSSETLMNGAMNGSFMENYIISEIVKSYENSGKEPCLYFYRDKDMKEIDLLLERDGELYPIEIKKTGTPSKGMISSFTVLEKSSFRRGTGALICLTERLSAFDKDNLIVPARLV